VPKEEAKVDAELVREFVEVYREDHLVTFQRGRHHASFEDIEVNCNLKKPESMKRILVRHCKAIEAAAAIAQVDEDSASSTSDNDFHHDQLHDQFDDVDSNWENESEDEGVYKLPPHSQCMLFTCQ
jgi:hypothetical protein